MGAYSGRMWLVSDQGFKLRVEMEFGTDAIKIYSEKNLIADWRYSDVIVRSVDNTRVHLRVEGEEVIISSRDPDFMPEFVGAVDSYREDLQAQPKMLLASGDDGISSFARDVADPWADKPNSKKHTRLISR